MNQLADKEAMAAWKSHPLTQEYHQYLKDRRSALMELWGRGQQMGPEWQREASLMGALVNLSSDDVAQFYEEEDDGQ